MCLIMIGARVTMPLVVQLGRQRTGSAPSDRDDGLGGG